VTTFIGLFVSCFLAATLLPGGSEALLIYLLSEQPSDVIWLVLIASVGNGLGSITSYGLGYLGRVKFVPRSRNSTAVTLFKRYGVYSLLLSWLPLVGDVLCIMAGYFKLPIALSSALIFLAKFVRYVVVAWLFFYWSSNE